MDVNGLLLNVIWLSTFSKHIWHFHMSKCYCLFPEYTDGKEMDGTMLSSVMTQATLPYEACMRKASGDHKIQMCILSVGFPTVPSTS